MWQKALLEQAQRLVRLHEGIEALEREPERFLVTVSVCVGQDRDPLAEPVWVPLPRLRLLELLRTLEGDVMEDMHRILRQVTQ